MKGPDYTWVCGASGERRQRDEEVERHVDKRSALSPRTEHAIGSFEPEPSDVILLLVEDSPKREGRKSRHRYERY
jgi:hypothetical protein